MESTSNNLLEQFKKPEYHNVAFNTLKKNAVYHVKGTKKLKTFYGEKQILTIKDIKTKEIIETFAPESYIKKCDYQKIDIDEPHYFAYFGMENKKNKENVKYKTHVFEIRTSIDGYESDEE